MVQPTNAWPSTSPPGVTTTRPRSSMSIGKYSPEGLIASVIDGMFGSGDEPYATAGTG